MIVNVHQKLAARSLFLTVVLFSCFIHPTDPFHLLILLAFSLINPFSSSETLTVNDLHLGWKGTPVNSLWREKASRTLGLKKLDWEAQYLKCAKVKIIIIKLNGSWGEHYHDQSPWKWARLWDILKLWGASLRAWWIQIRLQLRELVGHLKTYWIEVITWAVCNLFGLQRNILRPLAGPLRPRASCSLKAPELSKTHREQSRQNKRMIHSLFRDS